MKLRIVTLGLTLLMSSLAMALQMMEPWDEFNDPKKVSRDFNYKYDELVKKGDIRSPESSKGWSGSYWPDYKGSIAARATQNGNSLLRITGLESKDNQFQYESPSLEILKTMSKNQMEKLSPAEKLDILAGRYDYPLRKEVYTRASKSDPSWEGICHGWSPAAINHEEPHAVTLTNEDGIKIPFGASDIKGLLSFFYAYYAPEPAILVAQRCNSRLMFLGGKACKGINAGAFHIMVTNLIGERKEGMVVDITRGAQVWNQPVVSFKVNEVDSELKIKQKHENAGIAKRIEVNTTIKYLLETRQNWNTVNPSTKGKRFNYILELDAAGNIIGGEWKSSDRPDFAWVLRKQDFASHPLFEKLNEVYAESMKVKAAKETKDKTAKVIEEIPVIENN